MTGFWLKRRLLRTGVWLLVALLTAGLAFSMGILRRAHGEQQQKLRELEKSFPIWLQVSNPQGTQVDDLEITNSYVWRFIQPDEGTGRGLKEYTTHLCLKLTAEGTIQAPPEGAGRVRLVGITQRESVPALKAENGGQVAFFEGASWEDFALDRAVCLVPERLWNQLAGVTELEIQAGGGTENYRIIGLVSGEPDRLYVPWVHVVNAYNDGIENTESLSALVADNAQLSELKERMRRSFTNVNPAGSGGRYTFAVTVFDSQYMASHKSISQKISLLELLHPTFVLLCAAIGYFTGAALFHAQKYSYALLRTLGARRMKALGLLSAEYVVAVLVGGALYAGVYPVLFGKGVEMQFVLLTAACFTAGILISQLVTMRDSVLRTLQDRDEGGR